MGQCVAVDRLPCTGGGGAAEGGGEAGPRGGATGHETLFRTLQAFRAAATAASRAAGLDAAAPLAAACDLVEALLLGAHAHLPDAIMDIELGAAQEGDFAKVSVQFAGGPLIGEFATRSRQPVELCLRQRVTFAIRRPTTDDFASEPLVLAVSGLELHVLPEIEALRQRLQVELQTHPDGWHQRSAGEWWRKHKEAEFPLESSKLRRLCDSFTEVARLPQHFQTLAFWGYLHVSSRFLDSFDFHVHGSEVTVTAQARLLNPDEEELMAVGRTLCKDLLKTHRALAQHFAASTVNMGAMFEGRFFGLKGGNPTKIAKLFSAAKEWGPGEDRWHTLDDTWLCVDKKDRWGRIVEEQGRILWHAPGAPRVGDGRTTKAAAPVAATAAVAEKCGGGLAQAAVAKGCSGVAIVALGLLLLLPAAAPAAASAAFDLGLQ